MLLIYICSKKNHLSYFILVQQITDDLPTRICIQTMPLKRRDESKESKDLIELSAAFPKRRQARPLRHGSLSFRRARPPSGSTATMSEAEDSILSADRIPELEVRNEEMGDISERRSQSSDDLVAVLLRKRRAVGRGRGARRRNVLLVAVAGRFHSQRQGERRRKKKGRGWGWKK